MLIHEIQLTNLLSFGPDTMSLKLRDLNIFIGPNGSGKSNLIEAISLLQASPTDIAVPIREGGGITDWLWKGKENPIATIEADVNNTHKPDMPLRHAIELTQSAQRFAITDEQIENTRPYEKHEQPYFYYHFQNNHPVFNVRDTDGNGSQPRILKPEEVDPQQSILSQRKDPDQYPEITYLGRQYGKIRIYRDWQFGRYSPPRLPQKTDQLSIFLENDFKNLGLVLNRLRRKPEIKEQLLDRIRDLFPDIKDVDVSIEGGTVQVFLTEGKLSIPATRLSDGTLHYLCLLVLLLDPGDSPLICIEEPELGLHPDILTGLAELLKDASQKTQLIVTTHSEILVDALTDSPEDVVVCEKHNNRTTMERLDKTKLEVWLKKYRLGELWRDGEIGGNRW